MIMVKNRLTTDHFVELLVATLVLRGKRSLVFMGESVCDRHGMHLMHDIADKHCDLYRSARETNDEKEWFRFLVHVRNMLAPGNIGVFDDFRTLLIGRPYLLAEVHHDGGELAITFGLSEVTVAGLLQQADPKVREFVESMADAFLPALS